MTSPPGLHVNFRALQNRLLDLERQITTINQAEVQLLIVRKQCCIAINGSDNGDLCRCRSHSDVKPLWGRRVVVLRHKHELVAGQPAR